MGMDMLDVLFRLERAFAINIANDELERHAARRTPPDLRVGDIMALVRAKRPAYVVDDGVIADDVNCVSCGYNLRGIPPFTSCPECGTPAAYEGQIRAGVTSVLVDALGVDAARVTDDASIFKDLGAS
jgi:acyl carrier protein